MKKIWLNTILLMLLAVPVYSQTVIASDDFENSSIFTITNGAYQTGNSAAGDRPASSNFAALNSYSYGGSNTTVTLTSANFNTSTYSTISCSLRVASWSISSTGNGADAGDYVRIEISPDGGTTYYNTVEVTGNGNAYWHYSTGTGSASTAYDGNGTTVQFGPAAGGNRTTDGYSTIIVTGLPAITNLRVRITLLNNSANERWTIDDFKLYGSSCATSQPTTQASSSTASSVGCNSFLLSWTNGDGSNRLVVVKAASAVTAPTDLTSYTASQTFGSGTAISGGFVVYGGTGNSVFIMGLSASTTYYWGVYEYNGSGSCVDYLTSTVASGSVTTTSCSNAIGSTAVYINSCAGSCGYEGNNELIWGNTGSYGILTNSSGPTVQYNSTTPPSTTYISTYTSNASAVTAMNTAVTACGTTTFYDGSSFSYLPSNSIFLIANDCYCDPSTYDFSGLCGQGPIYVFFGTDNTWTCGTTGGIFGNSGSGIRYYELDFSSWGVSSAPIYNYNLGSLTSGSDGDYITTNTSGGAATAYGNSSCVVPLVVLPLQLVSFTANAELDRVRINWETNSERNLSAFVLEKSFNGEDFFDLSVIQPNNQLSPSLYEGFDYSPSPAITYYRLRITENNGHSVYSEIVKVNMEKTKENTLYTADNFLYVNTVWKGKALPHLLISDLSGRVLLQKQLDASNEVLALDQYNITPGVYFATLVKDNSIITTKKIIVH